MLDSTPSRAARERIHVIDAQLAYRQKRAVRQFVLRDPATWRSLAGFAAAFAFIEVLLVITQGATPASITAAVLAYPVIVVSTCLIAFAATLSRMNRWVDREFVPGRMLALTLGPSSIRVRDHDSAQEFAYSAMKRVEQYRDIVVIRFGHSLWVLPIELFEPVDLGVLRARAGRTGVPQSLLH
jgi:hypothetical protein